MGIYEKFAKVKFDFHHQEIKKTGKNTYANYNYMQLGDFTKPIIKLLHDNGLVSFVSFTSDVATLTIVDTETGEKIQNTSPMSKASLKGCHEVQNLGAVQTYIRRYLYMAMFDIVEGDALDGSEPLKKMDAKLISNLIVLAAKKGVSASRLKKRCVQDYDKDLDYIDHEELNHLTAELEALEDHKKQV